jgi:hypothetical protein
MVDKKEKEDEHKIVDIKMCKYGVVKYLVCKCGKILYSVDRARVHVEENNKKEGDHENR